MVTASPADQRRLPDVQRLDDAARRIAHRRANLPERAALSEAEAREADLWAALVDSRTAESDLRRELVKAEAGVEQVRARAARDQARLDSGQVGARDAQALVAELASLARRTEVLEEVQLDVMERLEAHNQALATIEAAHAEQVARREAAAAECAAKLADLDGELAATAAERAEATAGLDAALLALYEKVRDQNGGRGVVEMRGRRLIGLNVDVSLAELAAVGAAPPDRVVRLEDTGHIVVRYDD